MRKLEAEEISLLHTLDDGVPTPDLVVMVRDLAEILRNEGQVIRANVAEIAADRLSELNAAQRMTGRESRDGVARGPGTTGMPNHQS